MHVVDCLGVIIGDMSATAPVDQPSNDWQFAHKEYTFHELQQYDLTWPRVSGM